MTAPAPIDDPIDPRLRTAIHEAAHAIVAEALHFEVSAVVLFGDDEGQTHHWSQLGPTLPWAERMRTAAARREQAARDTLVVMLAGEVALELIDDPDPARGTDVDRQNARYKAITLAHWDRDRADELIAEARDRAAELLNAHWREVAHLADTIRLNLRLAAEEVAFALEAAQKGWPTPDFSSEGRYQFALRQRRLMQGLGDWKQATERARAGATAAGSQPSVRRVLGHGIDWRARMAGHLPRETSRVDRRGVLIAPSRSSKPAKGLTR